MQFQFVEQNELAPADFEKSVGAIYLFVAEQICNIVISPIRTSPFCLFSWNF